MAYGKGVITGVSSLSTKSTGELKCEPRNRSGSAIFFMLASREMKEWYMIFFVDFS
jgi:hypothetical protein